MILSKPIAFDLQSLDNNEKNDQFVASGENLIIISFVKVVITSVNVSNISSKFWSNPQSEKYLLKVSATSVELFSAVPSH